MKALTIRQPWASAIAAGYKTVENRTWRTRERGPIAVHASARIYRGEFRDDFDTIAQLLSWPLDVQRRMYAEWNDRRNCGAVLAVARLVACALPGEDWVRDNPFFYGPFGFVLYDIQPLARPVPVRGALGFWSLPPDVDRAVREQVEGDSRFGFSRRVAPDPRAAAEQPRRSPAPLPGVGGSEPSPRS